MSYHHNLSDDESQGIAKIREVLGEHIPENLNTDFNLRRWWIGHDRNIDIIHEKMSLYLKNRKVLKFDDQKFFETFYEREDIKQILQYFGMSKISQDCVNKDNAVVFVESGEFDKNVLNTSTTGHYLKVFFACCELVLQMILKVEKETGKPSYGICIFDMSKVAITNHINPSSGCNKVFKARAQIWEDFFPGMIRHITIANSPSMLTFIWGIVKFLLNEKQRNLLKFCRNESQLIEIIGKERLPVAFGGEWMDKPYSTKADCCNEIKKISPSDYYVENSLFKKLGFNIDKLPPNNTYDIKANTKYRFACKPIENNGKLYIAWKFTTANPIQFSVHNGEKLVYPSLKLVTTEVAEEDYIEAENSNQIFYIEFGNSNRFSSITITLMLISSEIIETHRLPLNA
uniref:CRAL-TRIO domain-containing protein n=1 Tax=Panagrolaimus sp. PS1159 TaxID=55785 RepID=A0AC35G0M4_9BILA